MERTLKTISDQALPWQGCPPPAQVPRGLTQPGQLSSVHGSRAQALCGSISVSSASSSSSPCARAQTRPTFSDSSALTQLLALPGSLPELLLCACTRISVQEALKCCPAGKRCPTRQVPFPKLLGLLEPPWHTEPIKHSLARGRAQLEAALGWAGQQQEPCAHSWCPLRCRGHAGGRGW